ncbi:hypothetical protein JOM56_015246 [Amanita muscaria]
MREQQIMSSLAQSVPSDVVREIFKHHSTPFQLSMRKYGSPITAAFPWYLCHVCASWRSVFLSMYQEFWSKYVLDPYSASPSLRESTIAQTQFFLQCNEGKPFSFKILAYIPMESICILEMLVAESTRWQDATLYITDEQVEIISPIRDRLPLLNTLTLDRETFVLPALPTGSEDLFENAPLLKHVTLSFLSTWRINWSSLTALRLTKRNEGLLDLLPHLTSLEELKIPHSIWESVTVDSTVPITLPRLKVLNVSELSFLSILTTPTLKELSIELERHSVGWYSLPSLLSSFFSHSTFGLQRLTLKDCNPVALCVILPYTPQIEFLEVGHSIHCGGQDYFNALTCSTVDQPLACQLKTLKVIVTSPLGVAARPLIPLIQSRTTEKPESVQPLQNLVFVLSGVSRQEIPGLEAIERQCMASNVQLRFEEVSRDPPIETSIRLL